MLRLTLRSVPLDPAAPRSLGRRIWSAPTAALAGLRLWSHRWQERQVIADLSDDQLRDIGRSRQEVRQESSKPFWKA